MGYAGKLYRCIREQAKMRLSKRRYFATGAIAYACFAALAAAVVWAETGGHLSSWNGAWKATDGSLIRFEPARVVLIENGLLSIGAVVREAPGKLTLRRNGLLETWQLSRSATALRVSRPDRAVEYKALDEIPPALDPKPLDLPKPMALPANRVQEVQSQLRERLAKDQAALKAPGQRRATAVIAENRAYLDQLVGEVGWIDADRFGHQAAADAVILTKHGHDLPLIMAAMPRVDADFKHAGDDAQMYTIFYDDLMIEMGGKQRYGTQLAEDKDGKPYVLPLEDPTKVDQWRKDLGLEPLASYLAMASKYLYKGATIRLPRDDE